MWVLRKALLVGGALALVLMVRHFGLDSIASALGRIPWWQFALACLIYGISMTLDTLGWRYTFIGDRPPFAKLLAARCAGQAVNLITAVGGVGGEPVKAWLLRGDLPYEASVPSLILAKTAEIVGQALLLATGIAIGWTTGVVGGALLWPMLYLLLIEVVAIGGFILVQVTGGVGWAGRLLARMGAGVGVRVVDGALRDFYRSHWKALLVAVGCNFAGWLTGAIEAFVILRSLEVPATLGSATVIEALGTGVRFATFFVPANLGTLEGANAAAFSTLGWAVQDGLVFSLVRRGRQVVWIAVGLVVLMIMGVRRGSEREARQLASASTSHE
jgi:glycosyltransferase 2 family protein